MENWKNIDGYPHYQISDDGRVKRLAHTKPNLLTGGVSQFKERILKLQNGQVYKQITLQSGRFRKTFTIHRLVALHFIPLVPSKTHVNHIDGTKFNNNVENLEWVTRSENEYHAYRVNGKKGPKPWLGIKGIHNPASKMVVHMPTGVFYYGVREVAGIYRIAYVRMCELIRKGFDNLKYA